MKKVNLLEDSIGSLAVRYMIPSVLGMLGLSMCIFFDTMFIGRGIGNLGLAALNVGIPMYSIFNSIGLIFGVGGATALSISIGKGRLDSANSIFTFSVISSYIRGDIICIWNSLFRAIFIIFRCITRDFTISERILISYIIIWNSFYCYTNSFCIC